MQVTSRIAAVLAVLLVALAGCANLPTPQQRGPGANYEDYLTGGGTLVMEFDHSPGQEPTQKVRSAVRDQMGEITAKQIRFVISQDLPNKGQDYSWSLNELNQLHDQHQDVEPGADEEVMHGLFLDGKFGQGSPAGLAYDTRAFAIFMGQIEELTCEDGAVVCTQAEESNVVRAVAVHEGGHLLGLVNSPLPMVNPHEMTQDPNPDTSQNEGEGHSDNENSVMYWQVETARGLSSIISGDDRVPYQFDRNDLKDAQAQRSG